MSKKKIKDPHADREATKYVNPIASREYIIEHILARQEPMNLKQLSKELNLQTPENKEALRRRLRAMVRDAQLEQISKRRYWPYTKRILIEGTVFLDKKKSLWVISENFNRKISLPKYMKDRVFNGNRVIVSIPDLGKISKNNKNKNHQLLPEIEGKLIEILDKSNLIITGRFVVNNKVNYVIPHSKEVTHDILIAPGKELDATDGDIVVVEVLSSLSIKNADTIGHVIEVLGKHNARDIEIEQAIRNYNLPYKWPNQVKKQITTIKPEISASAKRNRVNLCDLPLITIDGEDAQDFDDAVFCQPKPAGGWILYVAIADVSYYVKPNTPLDTEAKNRGNSVYFPTRAIPMLPEILSNELCSLKPNVERLCMVAKMNISSTGKLINYTFYEGLMRSQARLTYNQVADLLNNNLNNTKDKKLENLVEHIKNLNDLYQVLYKTRVKRGAIDFETVETKIIFGKKGKVEYIEPIKRNIAHRIIEECMLCANVATAKYLDKHKIPGIYRNHEGPSAEKLEDLKLFLNGLGLSLGKNKSPKPIDYGYLINKIKNRKDANVIQMVLLRSLCQAVYSPDNLGHFGLAYPYYTHFTSPIRRYPDLIVHRQIKAIIRGKWQTDIIKTKDGAKKVEKIKKQLINYAEHCSMTERRADDAVRDVIVSLKCQYIKQHMGKVFNGIISGVTRFGFFVELQDIYVDGLVHIASLQDDYFIFNGIHHKLIGERSGKVYSLGMMVRVQVAKVNIDERKIDFILV